MQQLNQSFINQLLQIENQPCISIFLPTTHGSEAKQNLIRLENALKQAKENLEASGLSNHQIKEQLRAAADLLDDADFWQFPSLGLALFICTDKTHVFRAPIAFEEVVYVGQEVYIKPLLPLIATNGKFFVLTLSQNDVKLYEATQTSIDKRFLGDMPKSMAELFDLDDLQKNVQHHSGAGGGKASIFHGQGAGEESIKDEVSQFLNQVENNITKILHDENAPLILSGVDYLTTMYKKHNKYPHLLDSTIDGNFEHLTKDKIHQRAWEIIALVFEQDQQKALEKYAQLAGTGKTSTQIEEVVASAYQGKVETLLVDQDQTIWGEYLAESNQVLLHTSQSAKSSDLIDLATLATLKAGGNVYSLNKEKLPKDTSLAAVYRY